MHNLNIQYLSNEKGRPTAVVIPIKLWEKLLTDKETAYLFKSPAMKKRLLTALKRKKTIPLEVVREKFGI